VATKRFRVAFSFAGEKRDYVAQVASILAERFDQAAILYDKFHEAEFARHDLGIYLPMLYGEESELIVPVLCPHYDPKKWTGWEWLHIYGLLTRDDGHRVMPSRFDHANVAGLSPAAGYIELDDKTPEQFAALILGRLALNEGHPKDYYTKPAAPGCKPLSTAIPNNLPRLQSFFGRKKELDAVREALDPESRTWGALIDGPGGMGKTSLAVCAAYNCPVGQFQRIIFVSVKDREMDEDGERRLGVFLVPDFLAMLNEIGRELGQVDIEKSPPDERTRLVLDALRPAQALVILDNLESLPRSDRDQLFNFVKRLPQGCKAILTSRRRIGSGSDLVQLDVLDQDAALATLSDLARRNPLLAKTSEAERLTLWKRTGGNPLLLRWVAGQLGRGNCRTFTYALHFLSTCPKGNDPLEFIFGDLANEFAAEEERVLVALTYFTFSAKVEHIAAIAGLGEAASRSALDTLANRSLVVPDQEEKQFSLVPMVAEFLRRHRPEAVREAGNRLEGRAYALIVENGYENHDRFPVLNAAWPTVAPALPLLLAGPNPRLQTACDALRDFLYFTGRWDDWLSLSQQAEARAVAEGDQGKAGSRALTAGWIHVLREQRDAVLACAHRAREHWTLESGGPEPETLKRAAAIRLLGMGYRISGDYRGAMNAFREALDLHRSFGAESKNVAIAFNDLAGTERFSRDFDAAERDYREALRVGRTIGDAEVVADTTTNLAALALDREDWQQAETLGREALPLSENLGDQDGIALCCRHIALALLHQGRAAEALPHVSRAVDIFTNLRSPRLEDAQKCLTDCERAAGLPTE
jgi:tetratricopeptide (TPR) repeat protein